MHIRWGISVLDGGGDGIDVSGGGRAAQWCTARYSLVNNINILLTGRGEERRDILGGREPDWDQPVVLSYFSIEFLCSRDKLLTGI